ncbi:PAS domain S-box protein [Kineococcus glutinatus]|uniref:histidine kinase n=1 Tax=Kineococcus glutinatus TaxID=1070872 RepID=A0ABP9HNV8_9ACTN
MPTPGHPRSRRPLAATTDDPRAAAVRSVVFAAAFCAAVFLGRLTVMDGTSLSLVWPAAGMAVAWFAAQRQAGTRWLDLVLLSAATFGLNALTGASPALAGCFVVANIAQVLTFGALFTRWCPQVWGTGGHEPLAGVAQLVRLLAAAVLATAAGAAIGPTSVWLLTGHWSWLTALVWMTRNTVSILLIAAVAFRIGCLLTTRRQVAGGQEATIVLVSWPHRWRLLELIAALACSATAYVLVFRVFDHLPVVFPLLVLTVWVALRFDTTIVVVHDLVVGAVAVLFTLDGYGPFALVGDDAARAVVVQLFVAVLAVLGLALALGRDERDVLLARMAASTAASERLAAEAAEQRGLAEQARLQAVAAQLQAELAMAEAEARGELTQAVLETIDVGIVVAGADGRLVLFNRAAHDWHGLDVDSALDPAEHAGAYDLFAVDGTTPLAPSEIPLAAVLRDGSATGVEMVIAPAGREPITVVCSGRTMIRADGTLLGAVVVMNDVTRERRQQIALRHSEAQLQRAFDASLVGNIHLGLDGTVLRVNAAAAAMVGRSPAELHGRYWGDLLHPEDLEARRETLRAAIAEGGGGTVGGVVRHIHSDGHIVHAQVSTAVVRDEDGRPLHIASQVFDVSDRVVAEDKLRRQRDVYSRLLRALSDVGEGVLVEHGEQITYVNEAFARLTGRRAAALLTLPTSLLLVPDAEHDTWRARRGAQPGRAAASLVTALRRPDGTTVPVEAATVSLPDAGGQATLTIVRDLSERLRTQAALAASVQQLEEANRFKDDLVATLSHDLRQPLATTIGFSELLLDTWDHLSEEEKKQYLGRVRRAGHWANEMVEDILTMAQLDQGVPVAIATRIHVPALVADLLERLGADAAAVDTAGVRDVQVLADRGHVERILGNLLGNALKYGRPPLRISARRHGDQVALDVVDSGEGVPAEFVPDLFGRFTRASTGVAVEKKGTGLGLYIARTLANANGGELTYREASGGGSRFTLTLNAVQANHADELRHVLEASRLP